MIRSLVSRSPSDNAVLAAWARKQWGKLKVQKNEVSEK